MSLKNKLLLKACKWLKPKAHKKGENRRILIVTTTALGDTLWATPTIESLRKTFPNAHLAALTSPIGYEVLKTNPHLNQIHLFPKLTQFFSLKNKLYREQFDTILILHTSQRLIPPLCALLGATQIVGTTGINKGLDQLLTHPILPKYEHEIVRRLNLMKQIGGEIHTETLSFFPKPSTRKLPEGKWIAIHPGSKDAFKRWPEENFIQVAQKLQEKHACQILITGTKSEANLIQRITSKIPNAKTYLGHNLHEFAGLLNQVDLLISNDTGPAHLACSLNRPVIIIYGATDPHLCGPYKSPQAIALHKPKPCSPCLKRSCETPFCLLQTGPQEVTDIYGKTQL